MSSLKPSSAWPASAPHPARRAARSLAAAMLASVGALLARLAADLAQPVAAARAPVDPQFEFHAEAGAPEGALYVDGRLVGWLPGVRRL